MRAKLVKLKDDFFNGEHPNQIYEGHTVTHQAKKIALPVKGERYNFGGRLNTSIVTEEMNEEGIFKTLYSTYKLEITK